MGMVTQPRTSRQPSISYSITVRLELPAGGTAISSLPTCGEKAGGIVTPLDVPASGHDRLRIDVTCAASDTAHADQIVEALRGIDGVTVHKVSDRTFLMHLGGTIEMSSKHPIRNRDDLSMVYTPGVARVCEAIAANPEDARRLTVKRNAVAVVTDGSAVLGLGNIGPAAALPVMEGKSALFKRFAGIDAWPLCLDTQDADAIVQIVRAVAPGFAGINLEDISAPRCFDIEARLRDSLDMPVFHDDQHGTAIVVLAALRNALRVVGKELADCRVVMSGAGAAGTAILKLLLRAGATDVVVADHLGVLHRDGDDIATMNDGAIVFAMANPDPEVDPTEAARHAAVVATGRSDFANQINNVLVFPGVFRGLLDAASTSIDEDVMLAAAKALSEVVHPEELNPAYIIPSVFHPDVSKVVAAAVKAAVQGATPDLPRLNPASDEAELIG